MVVRVDHYGNLVSNIRREHVRKLGVKYGGGLEVTVGDDTFAAPFVRAYGDVPPGDRLVLVQSGGSLEFAANMRNLADELEAGQYSPVTVSPVKE